MKRAALLVPLGLTAVAAQGDYLGLAQGYTSLTTSNFDFKIVKEAQVLASLTGSDDDFDFLPFDKLPQRAGNGQYHWGDITYRYRKEGGSDWTDGDTSQNRQAVKALSASDGVLAASDLSPTLPESSVNITREWLDVSGDLGLRFTVQNVGDSTLEIGSLGLPVEFNNIFTGRTAVEMQDHCSLFDPYIGMDAGYIRVTPVSGVGKALVVTQLNETSTPFEAYRNLDEPYYPETAYGSQVFEGLYEWQALTKAWAENEWANVEPWNVPSSKMLKQGESIQFGVRFSIAESIRDIDSTVRKTGTALALATPGYIVPRDLPARLVLQSDFSVKSITVEPSEALKVTSDGDGSYTVTPSASAWGRVRVSVEYDDERLQTIHYYITKATSEALADMGHALTTDAWFTDESDPFGRAPSVMTYDSEENAIVKQDPRAWMCGLSDEGGVGAYLAAVVKQAIQPNAEEVSKLEDFVNKVLSTTIQRDDLGVRKAIFYYDPEALPDYDYDDSINWGSWTSWNKDASYSIDRAYDYVHVAAAYWSLYRVARAYPDTVSRDWKWLLQRAYGTVMRGMQDDVGYRDVGLMGETVFFEILKDLKRENKSCHAKQLEATMKTRAGLWASQDIPYGSEMAWDSTGQEAVALWSRYFGYDEATEKTVDSVLGYTPTVAHWGWNGNARRYWDFIYGGKLRRIERQIHHYGSALNCQVLLEAFRNDPTDSYLLRVGYGGISGPLSSINQNGIPGAAFHSFPDTLKWDGYTGDYGPGFLGMALNSGTYVAEDNELGLVVYGGTWSASDDGNTITVQPRDPIKKRIFIGQLRLMAEIDAGIIEEFAYDVAAGTVSVTLSQVPDGPKADSIVVWLESTSSTTWQVTGDDIDDVRGGWGVPLSGGNSVSVVLKPTSE